MSKHVAVAAATFLRRTSADKKRPVATATRHKSPILVFCFQHTQWPSEVWVTERTVAKAFMTLSDCIRHEIGALCKARAHSTGPLLNYVSTRYPCTTCTVHVELILSCFVSQHYSSDEARRRDDKQPHMQRVSDAHRPLSELACTRVQRVFAFSYDEGTFVPLTSIVRLLFDRLVESNDDDKQAAGVIDWQIAETVRGSALDPVFVDAGAAVVEEEKEDPGSPQRHFVRCVLQPRSNQTHRYVCSVFLVTRKQTAQRIAEEVRRRVLATCKTWCEEVQKTHNAGRPSCCCGCNGSGFTHKSNVAEGFRELSGNLNVHVHDANPARMLWMRDMPLLDGIDESFMYFSIVGVGWIDDVGTLAQLLCLCNTAAKAKTALRRYNGCAKA